jgi:hypothetical protein
MNTSAFVATMAIMASRSNHANLHAACGVLHLVRANGGTNKKAQSALWALLPESTVQTFAQVKRISGAINATADKATDGAKQVRVVWLESTSADDMTDKLISIGVMSPRALLDLVAPRKDKEDKEDKETSAVETFLKAAKSEGFKESILPLLVWIAERHFTEMARILAEAEAFHAGKQAEAEAKQAEAEAKQAEAEAKQAEAKAKQAEAEAKHAEALAEADKKASAEKSAQAKQEHTAKVTRERATHPKTRAIIEA